jgi:acyl transferase domain-containing protein
MSAQAQDIAIIGMAGLYPGAPTVGRLWSNILAKVESVSDAPESWNAPRFHNPAADDTDNTHTYCQRGGFIEPFAEFDPLDFGIMPSSIDGSDPGHFLTLRVARDALADAGYLDRPFDRRRVGVIVGHGSYPHRGLVSSGAYGEAERFVNLLRDIVPELPAEVTEALVRSLKSRLPPFTPDTCPGLISNVLSGRIANRLDLMGPNYLVDAACASSLIALDAGMRELHTGRCDMMLVGGAQENTNAAVFLVFSMLGALSRRGKLRPFDKNADGTLLGEGVGFAVIKRLADAERDGDRIYATIKGIGLSSDGQGQAFLVPRLEGEIAAMERAYAATAIPPATVDLVEAHGTGTAVGDRTEVQAMTQVFGTRDGGIPRCAVGSVKSMISHTIPASGMASLFKTALALYHKVLPPTLCEEPNPELGIEKSAFYVNTEPRPWVHGKPHRRRAGVNAFGFGGINSHVVLEEYATECPGDTLQRDWPCELIVLRAPSRDAVREEAVRLRRFLEHHPEVALRDIAFTVNAGGPSEPTSCLAIVAESPADLGEKLEAATTGLADVAQTDIHERAGIYYAERPLAREGQVAFVLPGEGAQYPGMLEDLCMHFDEVRRWFDRTDRAFVGRQRQPLPSQVVFPPPHLTAEERQRVDAAIWSMEYALPLIAAADSALYHLLLLLGVRPQAIAGHSTAQDLALEAAAFADCTTPDNVMDKPVIEDRVIEQWVRDLVPPARLLAVGASDPGRVAALALESAGTLHVAMDNCPNQVVLCGGAEAIDKARATLEEEGALCQFLPFDRGYHTPMYRPICDRLEQTAGTYEDRVPRIPVYCTTTGKRLPETPAEIRRIMIDQWADPIRFRETIETMHADGMRVFVEVGPRGNLTGFVDDILAGREYAAIPCDVTSRGGLLQLHHALAQLCANGVSVQLDRLYLGRGCVSLPLGRGATPAAAPAIQRRPLKLKMDMPLVTLDDADRQSVRTALVTALGGQFSEAASILPAGTPGARPGGAPPAEDALMQTHLCTMSRFATAHGEVMEAALGGGQID